MSNFTVVYDACVFYPAPVRDLLMQLVTTQLFRARWTEHIHDEWTRSVLAERTDLSPTVLQRTRDLMNTAVPDCLVAGYDGLIDSLHLPDPDDRHVLAAAIRTGAQAIVTFNLKDFPPETLEPYEIFAEHPDDFIYNLIDLSASAVLTSIKTIRARLKNPPRSSQEYVHTLRHQKLIKTASYVEQRLELI